MQRKIYIYLLLIFLYSGLHSTNYYVSSFQGSDNNDGLSPATAWRSIDKLNSVSFHPGDHVLFRSGDTWQGMFWLQNSGTSGNPIIIDSYGSGAKPIIDGDGYQASILIYNNEHIEIRNLELVNEASHLDQSGNNKRLTGYGGSENDWGIGKNVRYGILVKTDIDSMQYFRFMNLNIHDIFPSPTNVNNIHKGYGILIRSQSDQTTNDYQVISDIAIDNCVISQTGHYGLWIQARGLSGNDVYKNHNVSVANCSFLDTGGSGFVSSRTENILLEGCLFDGTGSSLDSRMWMRGSGYWSFECRNVVVQENQFLNANGPQDSYGAHIDFGNENVVFQYNFSYNNEGGFVEILGDNTNCGYRYNISVNDGWRLDPNNTPWAKKGKVFWVSDFCGGSNSGCPNTGTFIYNNTAYVPNTLNPEIYVRDGTGDTHIYNNLIVVQSGGDELETLLDNSGNSFYVSKNIYFQESSFNLDSDLTTNAIYDDPLLLAPGSLSPEMYRLQPGSPALSSGHIINGSSNSNDYLNNNGGRDFFGNAVSSVTAPNIGAYSGSGVSSLPVILHSFQANYISGQVNLEWETSYESNNWKFEIEHSIDGQNWEKIGSVNARVSMSPPQKYAFTHQAPKPNENYYRLQQIDFDGTSSYSRTVVVRVPSSTPVTLFPNPTSGIIFITELSMGEYTVFTSQGQLKMTGYFSNGKIDLSELRPGLYFVQIRIPELLLNMPVLKE